MSKSDRLDAAHRVIEQVGLADAVRRYPAQLSGGMRMRASLARALVTEPRLLLLDEPFAALDAPLRARLRTDLVELQRRRSLPIVVITHDPEDVAALGGRVVTIDNGRVRA